MKVEERTIAVALTGLCLAVSTGFCCCAPKPVLLGDVLDTPQHHVHNGMRFLDLGRYDDALREFELSKDFAPGFSKAHVGSGLAWIYKGDTKKGIEEIEKGKALARTDEEKVFADVGLIRLYLTGGKDFARGKWLTEAEAAYRDAIGLIPDSAEAHYYMAEAYKKTANFKKARELFKKVLEINNTCVQKAHHSLNIIDNM